MRRTRGSAVLMEEGRVALIKRIKDDEVYYVFPGGGTEDGETPEEAVVREAWEELGIVITAGKCIAQVEFNGPQYFFFSEIVSGVFGSGEGEEFYSSGRGSYEPIWVPLDELPKLDVKPKELVRKILADK
ncbi:NUDIX hydrolase [Fictibacillus sp. FJAT-27399]|uniref:NUDIX hydrolase n=1 Tax=Fictibacillus sp. FJAT-27399 TaxID=1729689 RepID=UPI000783D90B|nr:NUDIX domain-containing protein [Fictibacillus sp. FJAT-27399]